MTVLATCFYAVILIVTVHMQLCAASARAASARAARSHAACAASARAASATAAAAGTQGGGVVKIVILIVTVHMQSFSL